MNLPVRIHLTVAGTPHGWIVEVTDEDGGKWGTAKGPYLAAALRDAAEIEAAAVMDVREDAA